MSDLNPVPSGIDTSVPSVSRIYDYFLGGSHNFAADREVARAALQRHPGIPIIARANRAVMRRAVRYALDLGITQFLDIGSGIPTFGNVHEIAQARQPEARIAYVDNDPVTVAHARAVLRGTPGAAIAAADLRDPQSILDSPEVTDLIDFGRPVALLLVAIIHFFPDDAHPADLIAHLTDVLAPGSAMIMTHATLEGPSPTGQLVTSQLYSSTGSALIMREAHEIEAFFTGFRVVEPGIVPLPLWRPEQQAEEADEYAHHGLAAVGVKE